MLHGFNDFRSSTQKLLITTIRISKSINALTNILLVLRKKMGGLFSSVLFLRKYRKRIKPLIIKSSIHCLLLKQHFIYYTGGSRQRKVLADFIKKVNVSAQKLAWELMACRLVIGYARARQNSTLKKLRAELNAIRTSRFSEKKKMFLKIMRLKRKQRRRALMKKGIFEEPTLKMVGGL